MAGGARSGRGCLVATPKLAMPNHAQKTTEVVAETTAETVRALTTVIMMSVTEAMTDVGTETAAETAAAEMTGANLDCPNYSTSHRKLRHPRLGTGAEPCPSEISVISRRVATRTHGRGPGGRFGQDPPFTRPSAQKSTKRVSFTHKPPRVCWRKQ